jgi:hypothetical protein
MIALISLALFSRRLRIDGAEQHPTDWGGYRARRFPGQPGPAVGCPRARFGPGVRGPVAVGTGPHGVCVWLQPGRYSLGHTGILR